MYQVQFLLTSNCDDPCRDPPGNLYSLELVESLVALTILLFLFLFIIFTFLLLFF